MIGLFYSSINKPQYPKRKTNSTDFAKKNDEEKQREGRREGQTISD